MTTSKDGKQKRFPEPKGDEFEHIKYWGDKRSSIAGIAQEARKGDRECAITMLDVCEVAIEQAQEMDPDTRNYLLMCIADTRQHDDANKGFNLGRIKSGAPKNYWKDIRDRDIAISVAYHIQEGMEREEAITHVAETYKSGLTERAGAVARDGVERAFKRFFKMGKK